MILEWLVEGKYNNLFKKICFSAYLSGKSLMKSF